MKKLVSVIMPCYNVGKYIAQALDSVAAQTYINWEIIAVDDCGPKDGTEDIILAFAKEHKTHRIEYIKHDINKGVSETRNTAIKNAMGEYIALLDPDDYWLPEHLEKGLSFFDNDDTLYFYSSFAYLFNDNEPLNIKGIEGYKEWEMKAFPSILCVRNAIPNSSSILRKEVFDLVGMYDGHIHMGEDCDLWIRIIIEKLKIRINPTPTIYYRKHSTSATSGSDNTMTAKHPLSIKHKDWMALHQRQALDRVARQIFSLDDTITDLKITINTLEKRLLTIEQSITKFKSLPLVKQLFQVKRHLHKSKP